MKIGIEAQRIFRPDKHGMDFVILEVLRRLQRQKGKHEYFVFTAPGEDRCLTSARQMHIVEIHCPTYLLWEQWALPHAVRKYKVEVLHCTSNTAPLRCSVPLILTLHDIIFLQNQKPLGMSLYQQMGWYYRRWNVPHIINHCQHIITVSKTEQNNILKRFSQIKDNLHVIYNGYSDCYRPITDAYSITRQYLSDSTYLLFLGNTDPRKNLDGILYAYNEYLNRSKRRLKLIITGVTQEHVKNRLSKLNIEICASNLIYTGYIASSDLPALYNGAFAFLCPSLLEGFGIPVLESMACGTPVITSNCSSLPEVAGKDSILINPYIPCEITDALIRLEEDPEWYQQQVNYGLERVKQFSWEHTANEYLKIYEQLHPQNS